VGINTILTIFPSAVDGPLVSPQFAPMGKPTFQGLINRRYQLVISTKQALLSHKMK